MRVEAGFSIFLCWQNPLDHKKAVTFPLFFPQVDDFVPVGRPGRNDTDGNLPVCCRSEHFPNVRLRSSCGNASRIEDMHTVRHAV